MPWLAGFAEVPADATPPRYSTARHPHAVGSYGSAFCTWADDHPGMHPRNTEGLRWWQRLAAYRLLEHDDQGRLVWRNALLTMARQVGKSWLVRALVLWRIQHRDLFGGEDQTVIHIAHKLPTATEVWRPAARWAKGQDWHVRWANGEQLVESPEGGRWLIAAAVDGVGVGFSLSMMVADEGWMIRRAVVEAADPALSESASPQLLLISTAGDSRSDLFGSYRRQALDSLTDPVNTLLMEWSAAGSCGVADRDAWRAASPIWSSRREAEILDKLGKLEELEIRQNYLNQWVDVAHGRSEPGLPVFTAEEWAELGGHVAESSPVVAGVEAWFSDGVSVAFAERVGGRVGVSVHMLGSVAEAAAAVAGVRTVLVGKSLGSDPAFAGVAIRPVSGTARGAVVELRRLADEGALMHDGSPELAAQVLTLRTVSGADGPRVRSHGRADAVKAAAWAAVEARVFVDAPRIF
jgi:hypothetical protein